MPAFAFQWIAWHILIPISTNSTISLFFNNLNSISLFFRHASHANPGADKKYAGSSSYILMYLLHSFLIHLLVIVYHCARIDHNNLLNLYSKVFPDTFYMFIVSTYNVFHCQITIEFFLDWQWRFIVSLPIIHALMWINTFPQHQTKFANVFKW